MRASNISAKRFALCVQNDGYPASLEVGKIYRVVPDPEAARHRCVRVVDESGEDYLYPKDYFLAASLPVALRRAMVRLERARTGRKHRPAAARHHDLGVSTRRW